MRQHGINSVRSDLFSRRLQAYLWDRSFGDLVEIEPKHWGRGDAERYLTEGWMTFYDASHHRHYADPPLCMVVVRVEDEPMEVPDEVTQSNR